MSAEILFLQNSVFLCIVTIVDEKNVDDHSVISLSCFLVSWYCLLLACFKSCFVAELCFHRGVRNTLNTMWPHNSEFGEIATFLFVAMLNLHLLYSQMTTVQRHLI